MPAFGLLPGTRRRSAGDLPQLRLLNMFPETAITEPTQFALLTRPGLAEEGTELGDGPIHALFKADGVVSGATIAVSDADFYVSGSSKGGVSGTGPCSIAGNEIGAIVTRGQSVNFWDGTAYRSVSFPDSANVTKVAEQGGRFVFLRANSQKYYWTEPYGQMIDGSGDIIVDPLDFASAENEPDRLVDVLVFEDHLVLGGLNTIEFHGETGDDNMPWSPTIGRVFNKGVRATGCMALWDNSFAWVGPENIVYAYNGGPLRISDDGIEELIAKSTKCVVDSFFLGGHEFLRLKLDTVDLLFDAQTREWCEWATYGQSGFVGGPVLPGPVFGSILDGRFFTLSAIAELDGIIERRFAFGLPLDGGSLDINNISLRCNPGQTPYTVGTYAEPIIELRISRDAGQTWGIWRSAPFGQQGDYRKWVGWRALGTYEPPGILVECRLTDPAPLRISGAFYNEPIAGRSR